MKCDTALNGAQAIKIVQARIRKSQEEGAPMYKVVFLDYSMPEMDGPQVASEIRQILDMSGLEVPYICCCTAYGEAAIKKLALDAGIDHVLTKPIEYGELTAILTLLD